MAVALRPHGQRDQPDRLGHLLGVDEVLHPAGVDDPHGDVVLEEELDLVVACPADRARGVQLRQQVDRFNGT